MNRRSFLFGSAAVIAAASTGVRVPVAREWVRGGTYTGRMRLKGPNWQQVAKTSPEAQSIRAAFIGVPGRGRTYRATDNDIFWDTLTGVLNEVRDMPEEKHAGGGGAFPLVAGLPTQADRTAIDFREIERRVISSAPLLLLEARKEDSEERTPLWWKGYMI